MQEDMRQVCEDIFNLLKQIKTHLNALAETYDLTPPQIHALYVIAHSQATMGQVACILHCDASNITGIVDRLVAQKLVTREENAQDRRAKLLRLTLKGRGMLDELLQQLPVDLGCEALSAEERKALHHIVAKLIAASS